ncbi:MAG: cupin domain-containing protein [Acidimicrobiia bacterium]|nr:cupin domain-containing protein [Acidimicrobiia bacterium]
MRFCFGLAVIAALCYGQTIYAPKGEPAVYRAPHKPHTKLTDVKAANASKKAWRQVVVDDDRLRSEWVQAAPGDNIPRQLHPDTRAWWVVQEGEVRFEIETVEPFVAKKGSVVQVPFQTWFRYEAVGEKPALMFETNIAGARTLYESNTGLPQLGPKMNWVPVNFGNRVVAKWKNNNKPLVTFDEVAAELESGKRRGTQRLVEDDRGTANFIYGYGSGPKSTLPPLDEKNKGHYHPESAEYWLIMKGQIRYPIEKVGVIIANEGDVVYVPPFTWHAPRWWGEGASCRLAMNGFPDISHLFDGAEGR